MCCAFECSKLFLVPSAQPVTSATPQQIHQPIRRAHSGGWAPANQTRGKHWRCQVCHRYSRPATYVTEVLFSLERQKFILLLFINILAMCCICSYWCCLWFVVLKAVWLPSWVQKRMMESSLLRTSVQPIYQLRPPERSQSRIGEWVIDWE